MSFVAPLLSAATLKKVTDVLLDTIKSEPYLTIKHVHCLASW